MKRPFSVAASVAIAVLASIGPFAGPAGAGAPSAAVAAGPAVVVRSAGTASATVPVAATVDRCATRSKTVTRMKKRYKTAKTKRGKARTLRLLNAARRSLKRCRAQKPAPNAPPAPGGGAAPAPAPPANQSPAPAPMPPPAQPPAPTPEGLRFTVNDGAGGTFSPTTPLTLTVTGLPDPPAGQYYRLSFRAQGPPSTWLGKNCQRVADGPAFRETGAASTLAPEGYPRWCEGPGKAFVWSGEQGKTYETGMATIASVDITVAF